MTSMIQGTSFGALIELGRLAQRWHTEQKSVFSLFSIPVADDWCSAEEGLHGVELLRGLVVDLVSPVTCVMMTMSPSAALRFAHRL